MRTKLVSNYPVFAQQKLASRCCIVLAVVAALSACSKLKPADNREDAALRVEAKRQQAACASPTANDQLKGVLFDQAIARHTGDRANLDKLADYSFARIEQPVVKGWDPCVRNHKVHGPLYFGFPAGRRTRL